MDDRNPTPPPTTSSSPPPPPSPTSSGAADCRCHDVDVDDDDAKVTPYDAGFVDGAHHARGEAAINAETAYASGRRVGLELGLAIGGFVLTVGSILVGRYGR